MRTDSEKFNVKEIPGEVWETLIAYYKNRDLIALIKREPELHPIARGFQIVSRNAQRFRKNLITEMGKHERYAAPVYFDWLEDQEELNEELELVYDDRGEEEDALTFKKKDVAAWMNNGVERDVVLIYMYCSADKFPQEAFQLVESKK